MDVLEELSSFDVETQQGNYDLKAHVRLVGRDLLVAIEGGDKPHIGAVAVAQPRPSTKNPSITKSTASVFCFLGHKEDGWAKMASETLASVLRTNVIVTAGAHWNHIDDEGIAQSTKNAELLVQLILEKVDRSHI